MVLVMTKSFAYENTLQDMAIAVCCITSVVLL